MGASYRFPALDDAYSFLLESKGLPEVTSTFRRRMRCLRASILISWTALEDGLDAAIEGCIRRGISLEGVPYPLKQRINFVLTTESRPLITDTEFSYLRNIRNALTHPKGEAEVKVLTSDAERTFNFCLDTIRRLLSPIQVEVQF